MFEKLKLYAKIGGGLLVIIYPHTGRICLKKKRHRKR